MGPPKRGRVSPTARSSESGRTSRVSTEAARRVALSEAYRRGASFQSPLTFRPTESMYSGVTTGPPGERMTPGLGEQLEASCTIRSQATPAPPTPWSGDGRLEGPGAPSLPFGGDPRGEARVIRRLRRTAA